MLRASAQYQCIFVLAASARLTVGRRPENELALPFDANVSGHAAFERAGGAWTIVDDGLSRNGSYLNGERVFGHRRLRDGDLLRLGATVLVYRAPGEDPYPTAVLDTAGTAARSVCDPAARARRPLSSLQGSGGSLCAGIEPRDRRRA